MSPFQYQKIDIDDSRIEEIFRLRFQVYCMECGYEDPCDYLNQLESDEYDRVATHFCACEAHSRKIIGTARIILPSELGLPVFNHFDIDPALGLSMPQNPQDRVGEISRLAISKDYRRRIVDQAIYRDDKVINLMDEQQKRNWRIRYEQTLVSGMYHSIYRESIDLGLTHLFAIMSDGLHLLLTRWGLIMRPIGPAQDYHGLRRPYVASIEENMPWFEQEELKQAY